MDKTIRVVRAGEARDEQGWALAYTAEERLALASKLLEEAWSATCNQAFPRLDRQVTHVIRRGPRRE